MRRAVPLRPIWIIMVAAKLNQSVVLVTKFCQNRLTWKGRSAGQRHIGTQTDRQTHRQTRLKIMTLQICNRAKNVSEEYVNKSTAECSVSVFCFRHLLAIFKTFLPSSFSVTSVNFCSIAALTAVFHEQLKYS